MPKAKQTKNEITKPEKALREGLQIRKDALEADGWSFVYDAENNEWTGTKTGEIGAQAVKNLDTLLTFIERKLKEKDANATETNSNLVVETNLLNIVPSPFEGQKRRRDRFTDEEISELADSIKQQGVLQPIIVRVQSIGQYEIVAGERRFLAATKAGLKTIPTVIRNVSDQVAFEIQTIENLQRKEPDPLDEAFSYKEYIEKYGMTEADLAVKFGKREKFISERLTLNNLIPEALEDIVAGYLPLGHAAVIAKFSPEAQKEILEECAYDYGGKEDGAVTLAQLKESIKEEITLELCEAVFSKEAHNLRPDGLACVECPQRTGFRPLLFADDLDEDDRCLNKSCFELKTTNHMISRRQELAATIPGLDTSNPEQIAANVPLVTESYHYGETEFGKEKVIPYARLLDEGSCQSLTPVLVVGGSKKGEAAFICSDKKCAVHGSGSSTTDADTGPKEWELRNKERELKGKIQFAVQKELVAAAGKKYSRFEDLFKSGEIMRAVALNYLTNTSSYVTDNVRESFKHIENFPKNFYSSNLEENKKFFETLSEEQIAQMLFTISISSNLKSFSYGDMDSTYLHELAGKYSANSFELIEAQKMVELVPKQFKPKAKEYLAAIEKGESAEKPYFWIAPEPQVENEDIDEDDIDENDLGETTLG